MNASAAAQAAGTRRQRWWYLRSCSETNGLSMNRTENIFSSTVAMVANLLQLVSPVAVECFSLVAQVRYSSVVQKTAMLWRLSITFCSCAHALCIDHFLLGTSLPLNRISCSVAIFGSTPGSFVCHLRTVVWAEIVRHFNSCFQNCNLHPGVPIRSFVDHRSWLHIITGWVFIAPLRISSARFR